MNRISFRQFKILFALAVLITAALSSTNAVAQYGDKDSSYVVRLGGLFVVKPGSDSYFSFGTQGEYLFAGPLWLNYGGLIGINDDFLTWEILLGFLGKIAIGGGPITPTIKADFMFKGLSPLEDNKEGNYVTGSTFGPSIRYVFENGRSIFFDLDFGLGKYLKKPKNTYFAIGTYAGFEF